MDGEKSLQQEIKEAAYEGAKEAQEKVEFPDVQRVVVENFPEEKEDVEKVEVTNWPEQKAPVVNVPAPQVTVEAPEVTVENDLTEMASLLQSQSEILSRIAEKEDFNYGEFERIAKENKSTYRGGAVGPSKVYNHIMNTSKENINPATEEKQDTIVSTLTNIANPDFLLEVAKGNVPGHSTVHKFGRNSAVGTSIVPITDGGNYQTPTTAQSLEFVSSATEDALDDVGMHELTIEGLDATGAFQKVSTTAHATDGTTAVAISGTWLRVFRAYVTASGAYATQAVASHEGAITLRTSGGGVTWLIIPELATNFGAGQSLCGVYTVPLGKTAYILSSVITVDTNKTANLFFIARNNILDTTGSFTGTLRTKNIYTGIAGGPYEIEHRTAESYPALTDIGFLASAAATSDISVEFELLQVDD